jgi:hypothetical protein
LAEEMEGGSKYYLVGDDLPDIAWPIDVGRVVRSDDCTTFTRMWTAEPASMRGQVKFFPQKAAWFAYCQIYDDNTWYAQIDPIGLLGGRWLPLDAGMVATAKYSNAGMLRMLNRNDAQIREELSRSAEFMQALALTERYSWHVALGQTNGLRIVLPTNPRGCLEFFKTREKREGESRRAALRHWVENHYREHGDREITYVCDHLRGTTEFGWRGLDAEIFVSQYDLEKNEFFRLQAAQWRAQRKHNRVVVRIKRSAS